jgi:predicted DNA-binding protein
MGDNFPYQLNVPISNIDTYLKSNYPIIMKQHASNGKRVRLSVDLEPREKKRIKAFSALQGLPISRFVIEAVERRIAEMEKARLPAPYEESSDGIAGSLSAYANPRLMDRERELAWKKAVRAKYDLR